MNTFEMMQAMLEDDPSIPIMRVKQRDYWLTREAAGQSADILKSYPDVSLANCFAIQRLKTLCT